MSKTPIVSVISPVFNVEKYFKDFLISLFEQTMQDGVEFIIVDDCSPDSCMAILQDVLSNYPQRQSQVKIIHNTKNSGLTFSRNAGLRKATGLYIYHCDSDDSLHPNLLSRMVEVAKKEDADIVMCNAEFIYANKKETYHSTNWTKDKVKSLNDFVNSPWTVVWNMLSKKELYDNYEISSPENISFCEDFHLSFRLCYVAKKIVHIDDTLYYYNRTNISSISNTKNQKRIESEIQTYLEIIGFLKDRNDFSSYEQSMCWRMLRAKNDWLYDENNYSKYHSTFPYSHKYILSCPYYNPKFRLMAYALTHHLPIVAKVMMRMWKKMNRM